jgi:hypothetical protein
VASSGIASLLLDGGVTAHSRFRLPLNTEDLCSMKVQSDEARMVMAATAIVWDEAPMTHQHCFKALDELLKELMGRDTPRLRDVPFGGKIILFGGDFRQILPVVRRGARAQIVDASIKRSYLWAHMKEYTLVTNMRVQRLTEQGRDVAVQQDFARWLLDVGEGKTPNPLPIPINMQVPDNKIETLVEEIFPAAQMLAGEIEMFTKRAILCPKNVDVEAINATITDGFDGDVTTYLSADYFEPGDDNAYVYPVEFLNSLTLQGMAPHKLHIKVGLPIVLLRNMNRDRGLMNGTRLVVVRCLRYSIQAKIISGSHVGDMVLIPRITLSAEKDPLLPLNFLRRQLPIRVAFAMTINKSQGQTFDMVGIYLPQPVFSHGQLYVALSRVGEPNALKVVVKKQNISDPTEAINVVYPEIF